MRPYSSALQIQAAARHNHCPPAASPDAFKGLACQIGALSRGAWLMRQQHIK